MDLFNLPFFRSYEAQLGWLISRVKNVEEAEANAKASEEAAKESEESAAGAAGLALIYRNQAEDFRDEASESASSVENVAEQVAINTGRIDNLVANAGDTDGNAELLDLRVDINGQTLPTAGQAVRSQESGNAGDVEHLFNAFTNYEALNKAPAFWFERGTLTNGAPDNYRPLSRARMKEIWTPSQATAVYCTSGSYIAVFYDGDGVYDSTSSWYNSSSAPLIITPEQHVKLIVTPNPSAAANVYYDMESILSGLVIDFNTPKYTNKSLSGVQFERGGIDGQGQDDYYNPHSRVRTTMQRFPMPVTITVGNDTQCIIEYYADNDPATWTGYVPWFTGVRTIAAGQWFKLIVVKSPASSNTYRPISEIVENVAIAEQLQTSTGMTRAAPNIIYQCREFDTVPPFSKWYVEKAAANQYDRIRINLRKTSDDVYVCVHDNTINNVARNPDGTAIGNAVTVEDSTLAELNAYDWGIKYGSIYAGVEIPTLESVCKAAAMYNMGLSMEIQITTVFDSDADRAAILAILNTYGITNQLIIIDPRTGPSIPNIRKWAQESPYINLYAGAPESWFTDANLQALSDMKTGYNDVYIQPYPWGSYPSQTLIQNAQKYGLKLYNSIVMSETQFRSENNFNHGYNLIECANVYNVKDSACTYADSVL